jgi:hypothetical protein
MVLKAYAANMIGVCLKNWASAATNVNVWSPRWTKLQHTTPIQKEQYYFHVFTQWRTLHEYQHVVTAHVIISIRHLLPHNLGRNNFHSERRSTTWLSKIIHTTRKQWTHEQILKPHPIILAIVLITLIFLVLVVYNFQFHSQGLIFRNITSYQHTFAFDKHHIFNMLIFFIYF